MSKYSIVWLRRDLRLEDNAALYHGLRSGVPIKPIFIFDENILSKLNAKDDARVTFLHNTVVELKSELKALGSDLQVYYDKPSNVWRQLVDDDDWRSLHGIYTLQKKMDGQARVSDGEPAGSVVLL